MTLSPGPSITQQDILSLPSPHAPNPNPSRSSLIWPCSTFSFDTQQTTNELYPLRLNGEGKEGEREMIKEGLQRMDVCWISNEEVIWFKDVKIRNDEREENGTEVWSLNVETKQEYKVGILPFTISNPKTQVLPSSPSSTTSIILAFSSPVYPSDYSPFTYQKERIRKEAEKNGSDIKVYDELFARRWDSWCDDTGKLEQLHYVKLEKEEGKGGRWELEMDEQIEGREEKVKVWSPLAGSPLELPFGSSTSSYSLSSTHLAFLSVPPSLSPAFHTRTNVYLVSLFSHAQSPPRQLSEGSQGLSSSPTFSPDGKQLAWLEQREDGYEADRNRLMLYSMETGKTQGLTEEWDRSPVSIEWVRGGDKIYVTADEGGRVKAFEVVLNSEEREPRRLTSEHSVSTVHSLGNDRLLLSISSFTFPSELYTVNTTTPSLSLFSTFTRSLLAHKNLSKGQEFWFTGSDPTRKVQGWILFPPCHHSSNSDSSSSPETKQEKASSYPLAFLCTGGPQYRAADEWCSRWNFNLYASRGYITVIINRTGSTGFGQEFTDSIKEDWGGAPIEDLRIGLKHVLKEWPEIDNERMASLDGSYGGFVQNIIQGRNEEFGFKCLVNFEGIFSTTQLWYAMDELYFTTHDFGGTPWQVPENYEKFNPQNLIAKWRTPELLIHGSKDYRVVESESIGVFHTLQRLGIPSRLVIFPTSDHWFLTPQNCIKWHEEVFKWIDQWTNTARRLKDPRFFSLSMSSKSNNRQELQPEELRPGIGRESSMATKIA